MASNRILNTLILVVISTVISLHQPMCALPEEHSQSWGQSAKNISNKVIGKGEKQSWSDWAWGQGSNISDYIKDNKSGWRVSSRIARVLGDKSTGKRLKSLIRHHNLLKKLNMAHKIWQYSQIYKKHGGSKWTLIKEGIKFTMSSYLTGVVGTAGASVGGLWGGFIASNVGGDLIDQGFEILDKKSGQMGDYLRALIEEYENEEIAEKQMRQVEIAKEIARIIEETDKEWEAQQSEEAAGVEENPFEDPSVEEYLKQMEQTAQGRELAAALQNQQDQVAAYLLWRRRFGNESLDEGLEESIAMVRARSSITPPPKPVQSITPTTPTPAVTPPPKVYRGKYTADVKATCRHGERGTARCTIEHNIEVVLHHDGSTKAISEGGYWVEFDDDGHPEVCMTKVMSKGSFSGKHSNGEYTCGKWKGTYNEESLTGAFDWTESIKLKPYGSASVSGRSECSLPRVN